MKIKILVLFLGLMAQVTAQSDLVKIQGKILSNTAQEVVIASDSDTSSFRLAITINQVNQSIKATRGYYKMSIGEEYTDIYLIPNYDLSFSIDLKEFDESIKYTGSLAAENNYLAAKMLKNELINSRETMKYYGKNEKEFLDNFNAHINELTSTLKSSKLDNEFRENELKNCELEKYMTLLDYPSYHSYITKNMSFKVSDSFYGFINRINVNDASTYKKNSPYLGVVDKYIEYYLQQTNQKFEAESDDYFIKKMEILRTKVTNQSVRNAMIDFYQHMIGYMKDPQKIAQLMSSISTDNQLNKELKESADKVMKLLKGNPAPNIKAVDANGKTKVLSDYRGKLVYIDAWATWCGPCMQELPFYEAVKREYKDKNIEFVSICVWDNQTTWKNFLEKRKLDGNQLFIEGQTNEFIDNYMIKGVPSFILIDKEGKIISHNALRPSDKALREELDRLLK